MTTGRHNRMTSLALALALALSATARAAPETTDPSGNPPAPGVTQPANAPAPPAAAVPPAEPATPVASTPAKPVVPKPRPRLSPQLTAQVTTQLPVWSPPPAPKDDQPQPPPTPPADPDVVQMAPVIVQANRLPRINDKEWLTPKALDGVLMKQYLSEFDRSILNRYTLPLIGISPEARARMMYEEDKRLQDLKWMNDQIDQLKQLDPAAAKELSRIRDQTFTRGSQ
jgi:hypothetical protein